MALTTPSLLTVDAFDASVVYDSQSIGGVEVGGKAFRFNVRGGDQVVANTLTILNNVTLQQAYSATQQTYAFQHILPANTLTNGSYYQATLTTKNAAGDTSAPSSAIQFYCYATPSVEFTNLPSPALIQNSSYTFEVAYTKTGMDAVDTLNEYVFNLYNQSGTLVSTSGTLYDSSGSIPLRLSYTFTGFEDNSQYIIQMVGRTTHGMRVSTALVAFNVRYSRPSAYSYLVLTNNCQDGNITVQSNVTSIKGESNPSPPVYIDDKEVDLRDNGSWVKWADGYVVTNDWTTRVWGRQFTPNADIFQFSNTSGDIVKITYHEGQYDVEDATTKDMAWMELNAINSGLDIGYTIFSNAIGKPDNTEQIFTWIRRINNLYDLKIENRGVQA